MSNELNYNDFRRVMHLNREVLAGAATSASLGQQTNITATTDTEALYLSLAMIQAAVDPAAPGEIDLDLVEVTCTDTGVTLNLGNFVQEGAISLVIMMLDVIDPERGVADAW